MVNFILSIVAIIVELLIVMVGLITASVVFAFRIIFFPIIYLVQNRDEESRYGNPDCLSLEQEELKTIQTKKDAHKKKDKQSSKIMHDTGATDSAQIDMRNRVPTYVKTESTNADPDIMNTKMKQVIKNVEQVEAAIVFIKPESLISSDSTHLDTLCSKYASMLTAIIIDKTNTRQSYHQTGAFYNPEGLLLSAFCSYMHILLPCDLERVSRLATGFYYRLGKKTVSEETIILNSYYIDYLSDQANKSIPELICDLNRCIAVFVAYPSKDSVSQLLKAFQNITVVW